MLIEAHREGARILQVGGEHMGVDGAGTMRTFAGALLALVLPLSLTAGVRSDNATPAPAVSFLLRDRHGHVTPARSIATYSGGGLVDVQQPTPDTVVVTMTGAVVAAAHPCHAMSASMTFDLEQCFDMVFEKPDVKAAKLAVEGRVTGLLRGGRAGSASESNGCATITCGDNVLVTVCVPDHGANGCENLSINDRSGPEAALLGGGPHMLHASWRIAASQPKALLGRSASADFAPDPAVDPLWVGGPRDPFHGLNKKDFGFQVILRLAPSGLSEERQPPDQASRRTAE
jgi:hypothetical protein